MSHSNRFRLAAAVAVCLAVLGVTTLAQQAGIPPPIVLKQLTPAVWVALGGSGGDSTIILGKTSVIIVDAKQTEASGKNLLDEVRKITPKPVTTVILTHSDGDHVNGLVAFPSGVKVIAHQNNKSELQAALTAGGPGAPPAEHLPSQLVTKTKETTTIDGVKLELYHWAPAHTSGDLIVYLPDQKLAITGDIIATIVADDNPFIHQEKNGSTAGWLTTMKGLIALNAEIYVPGHGDPQTKADLERKLNATAQRREKIAAMIKAGKSLEEIKAASPDLPPAGAAPRGGGAGGGRGGPPRPTYVDIAYAELTKK